MANTALIGLLLPTQGTLNGTWGDSVNSQITSLIDSAIAGTTELTADADAVLSATVTAPNEARQAILLCTGVRTAVRTIAPPSSSKTYVVINTTTGGFGVTVGIGGITVPAGYACAVAWNGASFVPSSSYIPNAKLDSLLLTNALTVANGGTGATTLTGLVVGNGTGAMTAVAAPSGTVVGTTDAQTLTNKTISGSDNTLSNIANASLTNSSVTINGETVSLGGSATIGAATSEALTVSTGLQLDSGTTFNGAVAKTISVDNTIATLTGTQTLTNKTLTTPVISTITNTGTVTLPTATTTLVGQGTTDTLTNKTISADDNTISGLAASSFALTNASGNLDGTVAAKVIPAGVVVGTTDTQTLTNKRVTERVFSAVSIDPLVPDSDSYDQFCLTEQATTISISNPTGTPTDGQKIIFRIKNNGSSSNTISWGTAYRVIGVTLPTNVGAPNKTMYVGCIYNVSATRWDVVAVVKEV